MISQSFLSKLSNLVKSSSIVLMVCTLMVGGIECSNAEAPKLQPAVPINFKKAARFYRIIVLEEVAATGDNASGFGGSDSEEESSKGKVVVDARVSSPEYRRICAGALVRQSTMPCARNTESEFLGSNRKQTPPWPD